MKGSAPATADPSWQTLVLLCKDCRKRGNGPADKAKELGRACRQAGKAARPRVLLTACQGLCPKRATCVTVASRIEPAQVYALDSTAAAAELGGGSDGPAPARVIGRQPRAAPAAKLAATERNATHATWP